VTDRFQALLEEMDNWLAKAGSDEATPVPQDELIQWHITLTTLHDEWSRLQQASRAAVDAFLLRPSEVAPPGRKQTGSGRPTGQKLYQRLAEAMAELEQVLIRLQAGSG
jgi:hypothetical protein